MNIPTEYEDLSTVGPVVVTYCGEENIYFTLADGSEGFSKVF